jgi:hypothetical protein
MKRLFLFALLAASTLSVTQITAQTSAVHVSFFPPLSTNGRHAANYTNCVSLNLLVGVSRNERALTLGGLGNIVRGDVKGLQAAGLFNTVGGSGRGVMAAGLVNTVGDHYTGGQYAGLANIAKDVHGLQASGLVNTAGDMRGAQFAGLFNSAGKMRGAQFAGLFNSAGDIRGAQFAGLFNIAGRVSGVQVAGLLNIAESSDYPIGLINIIRDGEMAIGAGYNEIGTASVNFRSGGRVLYGILGLGFNHRVVETKDALSLIGGVGAHIDTGLGWLRINNEITMETIDIIEKQENTFKAGFAVLPTFRVANRFELFAGPSINYMFSNDAGMHNLFMNNPLWDKQRTPSATSTTHRLQQLFVGWQVGMQFVL